MKFVVAQIGARRGYAVPAILEKAGMLDRFYTDIAGNIGVGRWLAVGGSLPLMGARLSRLANRRIPPEIRDKTSAFVTPAMRYAVRSLCAGNDQAARFRLHGDYRREFGEAIIRAGFGGATHVLTMLGEGGRFLQKSKARGLTTVSELYISLSTARIVAEERRRFPGWEPDMPSFEVTRLEKGAENSLLKFTDHFICPSETVGDDMTSCWGVDRSKIALVPYGVDPRWLELEPRPSRGRVLFAGTAELRKGIHYLAQASAILAARTVSYDLRVAGNVTKTVAEKTDCRHLTFLGRIPRNRIQNEFRVADVFVLPSLAEGSAEVTYEALAAGVPVVTTPEAGSVVRDGIDGRIVPSRSSEDLAEAIAEIVEDRDKRERMATAARERARDYTWERYGERLVVALQGMSA